MYVCMYVSMYVCMYVCMYPSTKLVHHVIQTSLPSPSAHFCKLNFRRQSNIAQLTTLVFFWKVSVCKKYKDVRSTMQP